LSCGSLELAALDFGMWSSDGVVRQSARADVA
jgi:hypothetical protein